MADTDKTTPGGWPWGKSKGGSQKGPGSEVPNPLESAGKATSEAPDPKTQDKGVQSPEVAPEADSLTGTEEPIELQDDDVQSKPPIDLDDNESQSKAGSKVGSTAQSAKNTAKQPSVASNGLTNGDAHDETQSKAPEVKTGEDISQADSAKEASEVPAESKSGFGSRFGSLASGAKNLVSFAGSKNGSQANTQTQGGTASQAPPVSQIPDDDNETETATQGATQSQAPPVSQIPDGETTDGGETATATQSQAPPVSQIPDNDTEGGDNTEDTPDTEADSSSKFEEGLSQLDSGVNDQELRPEDSITHANAQPPAEGEDDDQTTEKELDTEEAASQSKSKLTGVTETEGSQSQTQLPEGTSQADLTEGETAAGEQIDRAPSQSGQSGSKVHFDIPDSEVSTQNTEGVETATKSQTDLPEGESTVGASQVGSQAPTEGVPESQVGSEYPTEGQTEGQTEGEGLTEGAQSQVGGSQIQLPGTTEAGDRAVTEVGQGEGETTYGTETEAPIDYSILKGCKVNKGGNVVNESGQAIGRIVQGIMAHLIGRKCDENGAIWNDNGKQIGQAQPIPDTELQELMEPKPFENFEGNVIDGKGFVMWQGEQVGKVIEGDIKILQGKSVDPEGEVLDKAGNVIGKAERWEPEEVAGPFEAFDGNHIDKEGFVVWDGEQVGKVVEGDIDVLRGKSVDAQGEVKNKNGEIIGKAERWKPEEVEPEVEVDRSILAGKRVNKAGNLVDSSGVIYGRVVDGDPKRMIGRMCNKNGEILSESGDIIGHAEIVSEGEREGSKEGIFAELEGLTVNKDGKVITPGGQVVGRLVKGDPHALAGRSVDEDGDVVDKNGNVLGKAERWEEPEEVVEEREKGPMEGLHVNKEGNVIDNQGNLVGKLTSGDPNTCAGKEIDGDGDVINSKGQSVGHVNLIADIKEEEPEVETEEEKAKRLEIETDKKLARQMSVALEGCLDKVKPICKMIVEKIDRAERTPEDERDEDTLVKEVRPLIEEGGKILQEAYGVIKGLDPDGHIQANAKARAGTHEATPEEYHLADVIKELTGTVTETIDNSKRKLEDMQYAKKELNPLWGLLGEPLFQIIAAVGLLLTGVLGIVGRLLQGLGLGGILDGLLGTLGLNKLLDGLGLGSITGALTGKKKGKK